MGNCLNRTIVGLKFREGGRKEGEVCCLNRTIVGLK